MRRRACLASSNNILWELFRGIFVLQKPLRCHLPQISGGPGLSRLISSF
jgi:hypothetical protein